MTDNKNRGASPLGGAVAIAVLLRAPGAGADSGAAIGAALAEVLLVWAIAPGLVLGIVAGFGRRKRYWVTLAVLAALVASRLAFSAWETWSDDRPWGSVGRGALEGVTLLAIPAFVVHLLSFLGAAVVGALSRWSRERARRPRPPS